MRATIRLDSDVAALLSELMAERGVTLEEAVNASLRAALLPDPAQLGYAFPTYDLGPPYMPVEHALKLAADLEDEEVARKLRTGR